jgi:hypothetical protein
LQRERIEELEKSEHDLEIKLQLEQKVRCIMSFMHNGQPP